MQLPQRRSSIPMQHRWQPTTPSPRCASARSWEYGPFVNWGNGRGRPLRFQVLLGRLSSWASRSPRSLHAGIFSGQFEFGGNIMPLWQAYTPAPHEQTFDPMHGWLTYSQSDWRRHLSRRQPHAGHLPLEFPHPVAAHSALVSGRRRTDLHHAQVSARPAGAARHSPAEHRCGTSRRRAASGFTTSRVQAVDRSGVNAVHISSASLGDRNPGVNASIQVQVGYTFWK